MRSNLSRGSPARIPQEEQAELQQLRSIVAFRTRQIIQQYVLSDFRVWTMAHVLPGLDPTRDSRSSEME